MENYYESIVQGIIKILGICEELKGTKYLKMLFTPANGNVKTSRCDGAMLLGMPYNTYSDVAKHFNVSEKNVKKAVKYVLDKLTWSKQMWQDVMDYFGRLIEIDIYDRCFKGEKSSFTWRLDDGLFIAYIVDAVYHECHGLIERREKGIIRLYDSKNDIYLD